MRQQFFTYRTAKTLAVTDTYREDLPKTGYLSSIYFHVYGAPVTDDLNALEKWRIIDYINSIKVLGDTNDVIKSLTGRCLAALNVNKGYPAVTDQWHNYGSSTLRYHSWLDFGRKAGDPEYGLDLSKYDNVEIQVSNDAAVGQFASGFSIDMFLLFLRDVPGGNPFKGVFQTEEYRKITTVASKHDYIALPSTGYLRRCLIQVDPVVDASEDAARSLYSTLSNVKFTLRDGAEEHINCNPRHLWYLSYMQDRQNVVSGAEPYHTSLQGIRTGQGQTVYKASVALPQGMASATPTVALGAGEDSSTQHILRTGTDNASMIFIGHGPENTFPILFDHPIDGPDNYLNLEAEKTVELDLTTGSDSNDTAATYRVVIDRLVMD